MFEFAPLILFFAAFVWKDFFFALIVLMVAAPIGLLAKYLITKKVDKMYLWSTIMLYPFAGASLYFRNPEYLFWKPTMFYWIVSVALIGSIWIGKKPIVRKLIEVSGELPTELVTDRQWRGLSFVWAAFFVAMGVLNLYVAFNFSLDFWIKFKVFGLMAITMVFIFTQVFWIASKMNVPEKAESEDTDE
jgi:intracellular septation protein